jgi:hypothetical protein
MAATTELAARANLRAATFTGQMLAVAGALDVLSGFALDGAQRWVPVALGGLILLASVALMTGRRVPAAMTLALLALSAVVHLALIYELPFLALLMLTLDVVILDQLASQWDDEL